MIGGPLLGGVARLRFNAGATNVVFHGNSLMAGVYSTATMPQRVQALPPISGQLTVTNIGRPGYTWDNLSADAGNVDALYVAGKTNILVVWEGTNTIKNNGFNGLACYNNAASYTAARLALHPWWVIHMTTLPCRYSSFTDSDADAMQVGIADYNALLRANFGTIGAKALVDLGQPGGPFVPPPNNSTAAFSAMTRAGSTIWTPAEPGQWVHINDNGYAGVADMVALALRRLKAR